MKQISVAQAQQQNKKKVPRSERCLGSLEQDIMHAPKVSSGIFTTTLLTLLSIPAQRWWTFHRTHEAPCESVTLS
ncbi:hypothetical protein C6W88_07195 [Halomonas litopenaei]|jgi:hypothetical protein|uniref:Uncharacterized protein n=1 Tax=Halomonas litopenaei TaxID=2109328 RepID=A0ABX5IYG8_9GAMM|nr:MULTISPECIES: hypothetical protein [Halomonas]PTL91394.1 hypothetical protein C6W89_09090 [Halomonas sp. SYSU XM8]PTL95130.1 hypothetical protein C6W88_07195 [Halomonas litopenaei]QPL46150.1 hypothetical protein IT895_18715 [Halomonas sp. A40-4]|tara:strand:- start:35065 stop:35289 length:225 start_codon:yes stop_codon:yes gene_type:complete